jgi:plastocyanin
VRTRLWAAAGLLAVAMLAGCGGSDGSSSSSPASGGGSSGGSGSTIEVKATEFALAPDRKQLSPGTYTFEMKNDGQITHALAIVGPGVADQKSETVPGGGTAELKVDLQKGSYILYCPVGNHRGMGMQTAITVG